MQTFRLKGARLGRPPVTFSRADVLKQHAAGAGVAKIAAKLTADGVKVSRETVRRVLRANEDDANKP